MKIVLVGIEFSSQAAAKDFARKKLNSTEFDGQDPLWYELVERHPDREEKIGPGIKEFFWKHNIMGYRELNIRRIDGSEVDISFAAGISGKPKSHKGRLRSAMRLAIADQKQAVKNEKFSPCELCGTEIASRSKAHVDHSDKSFDVLAEEFLLFSSEPIPQLFDDCPDTNAAMFFASDSKFQNEWKEFHRKEAKLRVLCSNCNLTRRKK